ncbi:BPSL0067 family protein [Spirosoma spitsbergense]|uniref:BPSL0067 family protein n=1 Tax=Spirosoma spitsbergense TaxID=431554 RepID=UPI0012F78886|nr:BPSL0067 family protein [Spirosoma spitsbergense]
MAYYNYSPQSYQGQSVFGGECVRFVQATANMPQASQWNQGVRVRGANITKGTIIATFVHGHYQNHRHGNHAAVYDSQDATGIFVWDQYQGVAVDYRYIRFRGVSWNGSDSRNADTFYVVE